MRRATRAVIIAALVAGLGTATAGIASADPAPTTSILTAEDGSRVPPGYYSRVLGATPNVCAHLGLRWRATSDAYGSECVK